MVRHADDLMRDDLPDREDQIIAFVHDALIDLDGHRIGPQPVGDLGKIFAGDFAEPHDLCAPVVLQKPLERDVSEHIGGFLLGDRAVRAERGHHVHPCAHIGQHVVVAVGDKAGVGMVTGIVGREQQNLLGLAALQRTAKSRANFVAAQAVIV